MGIPVPRIGTSWSAYRVGQIVRLRANRGHMKKGTQCQITDIYTETIEIVPLYGAGSFESVVVRTSDIKKN